MILKKPPASVCFIAAALLLWQLPDGRAAASFAAAGQAVPSSLRPLLAYEVAAAAAATMRPRRAQELRQPALHHVLRSQAPMQSTDGGEGNHPTTALTTSQAPQLPPPPPPPPPELNRLPLPAMLAGGLLLFATSVPPPQREFATQLLQQAEQALRSDPTVAMELGMGIEVGGIYASSFATTTTITSTTGTSTTGTSAAVGQNSRVAEPHNRVEQLVVQFQITGGNAWASGVAYGMRQRRESAAAGNENGAASAAAEGGRSSGRAGNAGEVQLVSLEVANMDAVWNGVSFEVPLSMRSIRVCSSRSRAHV